MTTARPGTSGRAKLSRDSVVREAIAFVDEFGLAHLTMRRLGKRLGVEAMSLYRYVNGREDLLEAMVDHLVLSLRHPRDGDEAALATTWQGYLQWLSHAVRAIAVEHPHIFPLIATRNPVAPWLRPPLRTLEVVEDFLNQLEGHGFSDERAVAAYQLFSSFLLGHLLVEATHLSTSPTLSEEQLSDDTDGEQLAQFPTVARLAGRLSRDTGREEFEDALEIVIDRLQREPETPD